jgi:hypothetical protein
MATFHLKPRHGLKPLAEPQDVEPGDVIKLYWEGYFQVTKVIPRTQQESDGKGSHMPGTGTPLVRAKRLADEHGTPTPMDEYDYASDASWVTKLSDQQVHELGLIA